MVKNVTETIFHGPFGVVRCPDRIIPTMDEAERVQEYLKQQYMDGLGHPTQKDAEVYLWPSV